jgi:hypothetical protein
VTDVELSPEAIAAELTDIYRTPNGTMALRPLQGRILLAAADGGVFSNAAVGLGKSLCCAIAMTIIGGNRPLVFTENSNVPQMKSDFESYRLHWQMPTYYRLESYDKLGPESGARLLEELKPTCVILDECQKVKHVKESSRARRIDRWRLQYPDVPVIALSGDPGAEFADYAHLICWAVPAARSDRGGWVPVNEEGRPEGPAFRKFCVRLREDEQFHTQFWSWLQGLQGVVISAETFTDIPLEITHTVLDTPAEMEPHWERLRRYGEAPDGWSLVEGPSEQWQMARMFSNGMYYEHVPRPPEDWRQAKKDWYRFCRPLIEDETAPGGPWDTEGQIAKAVLAGQLPCTEYKRWKALEHTYKPDIRTTWLSRHALEYAHRWGLAATRRASARSGGSIIWVEPIGVGEELSRMTGWPYYGPGAKNARGQHVSLADRNGPPVIICSVKSCGTGKNLQHRYSHNLFMVPPSNNSDAEQRIGRTHRSGQVDDRVTAEFLYGCVEDWTAVLKAEHEAGTAEKDLTCPRKLSLAEHTRTRYPAEGGMAWTRAADLDPVVVRVDAAE